MPFNLPEELVDRIFSHISSNPTLHALCLVSKDINRIATTHLYTSLVLDRTACSRLRSLALLFWTSEKHSSLVRSFTVLHGTGIHLAGWPAYPQLDEIIRGLTKRFVLQEENDEAWSKQIRYGIGVLPLAGLVLRGLPNVRVLKFGAFEIVDREKLRPGDEGYIERELSEGWAVRRWKKESK